MGRAAAVRWSCGHRRDASLRLAFAAAGVSPILGLALALGGLVPLPAWALGVVAPAAVLAILLGTRLPAYGREALGGYALGLVAVLAYDASRLPLLLSGRWPDFIPGIGALMLGRPEEHLALGYAWRWLGNGAGLGLAFALLYPVLMRRLDVRAAGLLFGVAVWGGLLGTLLVAPAAQTLLFRLTPSTGALSLLGHLVYGGVLGLGMAWTGCTRRPYRPDRPPARRPAAALHRALPGPRS